MHFENAIMILDDTDLNAPPPFYKPALCTLPYFEIKAHLKPFITSSLKRGWIWVTSRVVLKNAGWL